MDTETIIQLAKVRALTESGEARNIRQNARLSLPDIASAVGSHPSTVYRWENGERRPHGDAAIRYGNLLDELLEATG
jgi:DNA-binding transcriptional regulator YiaG